MKHTLFLIALLFTLHANAQMYAEFAFGGSTTKSPVVSGSLGYTIHNAFVQADVIALTNEDEPAYFGARAGYSFRLADFTLQPGAGSYYGLYSLDAYDKYKNSFHFLYGGKLFYKNWFVQTQRLVKTQHTIFSFGVMVSFNESW